MSGRRYDSATIAEARRLARGGWSAYRIARILNARGIPVVEGTVRLWVDPRHAERRRVAQQKRMNKVKASRVGAPWMRANATIDYRMARLNALAGAGLSAEAVATVLQLDFDQPITAETVARALATGEPPRQWRARRKLRTVEDDNMAVAA